jgi:hypothetical protein
MPDAVKVSSNSSFAAASYANVFKTVNGTITGTGSLTLWTPATGKRFVVKSLALSYLVTTAFTGSGTSLQLLDDTTVIGDVQVFSASAAIGLTNQITIDLRQGIASTGANKVLSLKFNSTIGAGVLAITCISMGTELV